MLNIVYRNAEPRHDTETQRWVYDVHLRPVGAPGDGSQDIPGVQTPGGTIYSTEAEFHAAHASAEDHVEYTTGTAPYEAPLTYQEATGDSETTQLAPERIPSDLLEGLQKFTIADDWRNNRDERYTVAVLEHEPNPKSRNAQDNKRVLGKAQTQAREFSTPEKNRSTIGHSRTENPKKKMGIFSKKDSNPVFVDNFNYGALTLASRMAVHADGDEYSLGAYLPETLATKFYNSNLREVGIQVLYSDHAGTKNYVPKLLDAYSRPGFDGKQMTTVGYIAAPERSVDSLNLAKLNKASKNSKGWIFYQGNAPESFYSSNPYAKTDFDFDTVRRYRPAQTVVAESSGPRHPTIVAPPAARQPQPYDYFNLESTVGGTPATGVHSSQPWNVAHGVRVPFTQPQLQRSGSVYEGDINHIARQLYGSYAGQHQGGHVAPVQESSEDESD
jgi:hypothetical protein